MYVRSFEEMSANGFLVHVRAVFPASGGGF
jgi:hypothetical protein